MEREIRRYRDHLVSIGTGVSLFGLWSVIKAILTIIMDPSDYTEIPENTVLDPFVQLVIIICAVVIVLGIILALHLYIGLSARAEGLGKKKKMLYLVFTGLVIGIYMVSIISEIAMFSEIFTDYMSGAVTIFIDITTLVTLIELERAAYKVRTLSRQLVEQR